MLFEALRDCVMAALLTLDQSVRVQILLPQPTKKPLKHFFDVLAAFNICMCPKNYRIKCKIFRCIYLIYPIFDPFKPYVYVT